jgi:DivIVA domain-containing protein
VGRAPYPVPIVDRDRIERRDFPTGRRGYDPAAVDEHLRRVADEFEARVHAPAPTLSSGASEQVRVILEAAERGASQMRAQAGEEASTYVARVQQAADGMLAKLDELEAELGRLLGALRTSGERLAQGLAELQTEATRGFPGPLDDDTAPAADPPPARAGDASSARAADSPPAAGSPPAVGGDSSPATAADAPPAAGSPPAAAGSPPAVGADSSPATAADAPPAAGSPPAAAGSPPAAGGDSSPATAADAPPAADSPRAATASSPPAADSPPVGGSPRLSAPGAPDWPSSTEVGGDDAPADALFDPPPADDTLFAPPPANGPGEDFAAASPPAPEADEAGARLIALNMALSGSSREDTAAYLAEHFALPDAEALLDDVYARAGR